MGLAVGFGHPSLELGESGGCLAEDNLQGSGFTGGAEAFGEGAGCAAHGAGLDAKIPQGHAVEGEAAGVIASQPAAQFAGSGVGKQVDHRVDYGREAVACQHRAGDRGAAAEAQRHDIFGAHARRAIIDAVADEGAVEALGLGDGLGQRPDGELTQQGVAHAGGAGQLLQFCPVQLVPAAGIQDRLHAALGEAGGIGGGHGVGDVGQNQIELKLTLGVGESLGHPSHPGHATHPLG